jgi:SAM-dependent methyltransferase
MIRSCPACGGSGEERFPSNVVEAKFSATTFASRKSPELMHHALALCQVCSSLFVETLPNSKELIQNYVEASFDSQVESEFAAKTYVKYLAKLRLLRGKKVLDIGCGDGTFLKLALLSGASSVLGVEPSRGALKSAGEMNRLIREGSFESCDFSEEFDLVTCFQTLEHLSRPDETLTMISDAVTTGGHIAVVCHDRLSIVNRLLGRKSPIFDVEHLQMFSRDGLEALIRSSGFYVIHSRAILNRYPLGYWLRLFPLPRRVKTFVERFRRSTFLSLPISIPVGNRLVVAKKVS